MEIICSACEYVSVCVQGRRSRGGSAPPLPALAARGQRGAEKCPSYTVHVLKSAIILMDRLGLYFPPNQNNN